MRTKSVDQAIQDTEEPEFQLRRALGPLDLIVFGIGVIIGTGIFVLTGVAAHNFAGPAISLSFVFSGIACAAAALCYAEFASTVPVAGSAYTFSYASIGEFFAWIIGWDLILEFTVAASAVSVGWSQYFNRVLETIFGVSLPAALTSAPSAGGIANLPGAAIALLLTVVLVVGIRLSSSFNVTVTAIKLAVVVFFIVVGVFYVNVDNWSPFVPPAGSGAESVGQEGEGSSPSLLTVLTGVEQQSFGFAGIITGAAIVFFAYIGFDIVATTAEEARNPQRDLPIGILGSLAICTVLYVLVSQIMTGIVPYNELDTAAPMASVFQDIGLDWAAGLVSIGALAGLTSVVMILMLGQSRVAFAMSRDNLLPRILGRSHPRFRTPYIITIITGVFVAIIAAFVELGELAELVNIGTLFAFVLVSIGVVVLRFTSPDLPRAFRLPLPLLIVTAIVAVLCCGYLMLALPTLTWLRFLVWLGLGLLIYFAYGFWFSRQRRERSAEGS